VFGLAIACTLGPFVKCGHTNGGANALSEKLAIFIRIPVLAGAYGC
jgi:hypothetical protein